MPARRVFLQSLAAGALASCDRSPPAPAPFPGKASDLILLTDRPVNLETPLHYFRGDLTPNEAFFVRWHMPVPQVQPATFRLEIGGETERQLSFSLDDLRHFPAVSVVAVNQCSGNSRGLFSPAVPGVQWGNGAMGNARFSGVRLTDLLKRAGLRSSAVEVSFHGLGAAALPTVPAFVKSLPLSVALSDDVIVAQTMNGATLPPLNGFPLRLVVPGYYSTYWVKALSRITVHSTSFDGFWMKKGYRVPAGEDAHESPTALAKETRPISKMNVRSLLVSPMPGERLVAQRATVIEGIAFDGGTGIARVEISTDAGGSWHDAALDRDLGRYSFRRFRLAWTPSAGTHVIMARATSTAGERQRETPVWNRSGYMQNVIELREIVVA